MSNFRHHKSVCERAVWHLWQQKNKTPVVCAPVRVSVCALTCARGDFRPPLFKIVIPCPYFFHFAQDRVVNSPFFVRKTITTFISFFWYLKMTKMRENQFNCADSCVFFPLSPFISPYTYRAILLRCWLFHPTTKCATSTSPLTDKPVFSYSLPTSQTLILCENTDFFPSNYCDFHQKTIPLHR